MRIDSSSIGMDSARKYSSFTTRVTRVAITNSRQRLQDGTGGLLGNGLHTSVKKDESQTGKKNPEDALKSSFDEMRAKMKTIASGGVSSAEAASAQQQFREIRQQCLNFLMAILFPDKRGGFSLREEGVNGSDITSAQDVLASNAGVEAKTFTYSNQYYHEETETTAFSTTGTVRCADGREINFNLNLEMSRSFQEYYESLSRIHIAEPTRPY